MEAKIKEGSLGTGNDLEPTHPAHPDSFSLAHLSDPHLTSLSNIKISQLFNKRILGYLSWLYKRRIIHRREIIESLVEDLKVTRPDHIAVTGDLTHLGLPMEYAEVSRWLSTLAPPDQVTVIPGNHEAYAGKDWFNSCAMWAPYLASDDGHEVSRTADFFPSLRIHGQIALIGLCTARPSLPFLAIGSLGQKQLSALETILKETGKKGLLRVVLIHHPPVPGIVPWRKRLTDSSLFAAVLAEHGAELVLHGHAHTSTISEMQTPASKVPVIGVPSASELSPSSGKCAKYNIYHIRRNGKQWQVTMSIRGYSEASGRFVAEKEIVLNMPSS